MSALPVAGTPARPPTPPACLRTRAARRKALVGKKIDDVLELTRGLPVTTVYSKTIVVRVDEDNRVIAVW